MDELIKNYLHSDSKVAVVGASIDSEKYGHKVFKFLLDRSFEVLPVNPKYDEILGVKVYPVVESLPVDADVVDIVVPPAVGMKIVEQISNLNYKPLIWLQPGAESEEIINFCSANNLPVVYGRCIMQEVLRMQNAKVW